MNSRCKQNSERGRENAGERTRIKRGNEELWKGKR
jgi:hypothetical protein